MHWLLTNRFGTRHRPIAAHFAATGAVVATAALLMLWLWPILDGYPFVLFYPAIILCAVLFNHRSGVLAVALSVLAAKVLFLPPTGSLRIETGRVALALSLFILIGLLTAILIEELHRALRHATLANQKLAAAEEEKDLLLREATHRFKNDLSVIIALLRMQERSIEDPKARAALKAASDRLAVMGRVHERLRRSDGSVAVVSTDEFIQGLCDDLKAALIGLRPISMQVAVERHLLSQDRAVAVGLIINELLTNALKHAFPDDRHGHVRVSFERAGEGFVLRMSDNGVGIAPHTGTKGSGLGQRLVRSMADQIGGTLDIKPEEGGAGTVVTVRFPATS
jgi:two-component sensor histidine kinase